MSIAYYLRKCTIEYFQDLKKTQNIMKYLLKSLDTKNRNIKTL